jgi:hypothetical protein
MYVFLLFHYFFFDFTFLFLLDGSFGGLCSSLCCRTSPAVFKDQVWSVAYAWLCRTFVGFHDSVRNAKAKLLEIESPSFDSEWDNPVYKLTQQVTQSLQKIMSDPSKPFCTHYGAVSILMFIGCQVCCIIDLISYSNNSSYRVSRSVCYPMCLLCGLNFRRPLRMIQ